MNSNRGPDRGATSPGPVARLDKKLSSLMMQPQESASIRHNNLQVHSDRRQISQPDRCDPDDRSSLSCRLQPLIEFDAKSRLLPVSHHSIDVNSEQNISINRHRHHRSRTSHLGPSLGGRSALLILVNILVCLLTTSVLLSAGSSRKVPYDDSREPPISSRHPPYEQRRSINQRGVNNDYEEGHQHTNCPHQTINSHKSQQHQHHHQQQQHHYHYDQAQANGGHHDLADDRNQQDAEEGQTVEGQSSSGESKGLKHPLGGQKRRPASGNNAKVGGSELGPGQELACDDCLAIPLVAVAGDKQINGFIITPSNLQRQTSLERPSNYPRAKQRHNQHDATYGGSRQPYLHRQQHPAAGYKAYAPATVSLEPESDEQCPMTGPLTVCDHIGSYPTDVILNKLDSAKKRLGESHFNLDSFFSDERDNSNDPFESQQKKFRPKSHHNVTMMMGVARMKKTNTSHDVGYPAEPNANIYSHLVVADEQEPQYARQPERRTRANKGYSRPGEYSRDENHSIPAKDRSRPTAAAFASVQDDFVELVERQAISLAEPRRSRPEDSPYRPGTLDSATHPRDSFDRLSRGPKHQHESEGSILTSDRTKPARLFMAAFTVTHSDVSNSKTTTRTKKTTFGRHKSTDSTIRYDDRKSTGQTEDDPEWSASQSSQGTNLSQDSQTTLRHSLEAAGSTSLLSSSSARARPEPQTDQRPASRRKVARSRRQVNSVRVAASSGGSTTTPDQVQRDPSRAEPSNADPDTDSMSNSDVGDDNSPPNSSSAQPDSSDSQAEPVCRVKSIYISPRAALNDKKQWKYVVNAPERNPQIRQIIRVDICQNPFAPCSDQVSIPFGFTSECKQKYSKKKLLALDAKSGLLEVDTFFIPSCCVCQLIRSDSNPIEDSSSSLQQQPPTDEVDANLPPPNITSAPASGQTLPPQPAEDS